MRGRGTHPTTCSVSGDDWSEAAPLPFRGHAVWHIALDLDAERRANGTRLLNDDERDRADRFLRPQDRDRFIASHAALRIILGGLLGANPRSLTFAISPTGRPSLTGWDALARGGCVPLDFNLSHSGDHALVAVSTTARIGVDIEAHRPLSDALRIARAHFHPREIAALEAAGPNREAAFYAAWTAKEAVVKASGAGLSQPLDGFAVTIPPVAPALLDVAGTPSPAWTLIRLAPAPGATGAVAIEASHVPCRLWRLPVDWMNRPMA